MHSRTLLLVLAWSALLSAGEAANAEPKKIKTTHQERKAAAVSSGLTLASVGTAQMSMPGTAPHYFSVPNYANSPLHGLPNAVVKITSVDGAGSGAAATATVDPATGAITAIDITTPGTGYTTAPTVAVTLRLALTAGTPFTAASATATLGYTDPVTGEFDPTGVGAITLDTDPVTFLPMGGAGYLTPGIRKFVDTLPGVGPAAANNLGNYIPVAMADTTTYPGSDYYEIAVVEYMQQMHSDLPPTLLRGYVQLSTSVVPGRQVPLTNVDGTPILLPNGQPALGVDNPRYLGPVIIAEKNMPVRILFRNLLPTGVEGNLFLPVDTSVMGAGMGPLMGGMAEPDPQNPMSGMIPKPYESFTENRATLHLHGGISPWISDGTPHQWITPANENTPYPKGVSVRNVPDMPDPGPGAMTFFYSNQQSARLMFYHDHAWGITRLNVYAGEAAGYLITDATEQRLVNQGLVPAEQLFWIIQDKTFVPDEAQLAIQDPTWDPMRWGGTGNLWVPHVYVPAQNPGDSTGVNQFGRWAYGPWFWPPTASVAYGPLPNPYYDPFANPDAGWTEPPLMPGTPFVSMGMEAFNDTPVVNGTAYPSLTVEPKAYRLRILNAANDRFFNLSLYVADSSGTEVALNAGEVAAALDDPTIFPTPDETLSPKGPAWIQIGTEGGFLPAPVAIPAQPTTWVNDPTVFNAGNVDKHSLLIAPAERADVVVDFSQFAGKTLIVYNDAPAAFPARDPRYDYYTGNADLTDTGGAPSTQAGYGPNTRTVMQIKVADSAPAAAYQVAPLEAAFAHKPDGSGVFESSQHPIIVGQAAYNSAYGTTFPTNGPGDGLVRITDFAFTFKSLLGASLSFPLQPKAIQDEMGEAFDRDYGRMSGNLGLEAPFAQAGAQNLILYPYINPATEVFKGVELPVGQMEVTRLATNTDGTQIWKITHNGVDTHPIHFHLSDVQLVNRVGWDGIIRRPDPNELGWKDTVRVSPLEDTIVALRPIIPKAPFGLPDSIRPLNPMMPIGSTAGFNNVDPNGNPITPPITNQLVNFSWEYVWHCHILSHEEMDMMRPLSVNVARAFAAPPMTTYTRTAGLGATLTWVDGTMVNTDPVTWGSPAAEIGFRIERAPVDAKKGTVGQYVSVATMLANRTSYTDTSPEAADGLTPLSYRVVAFNAAGDSASMPVLVGPAGVPIPLAPTSLTSVLQFGPKVVLTWAAPSDDETGFVIERAIGSGPFVVIATPAATNSKSPTYTDSSVAGGQNYRYRVNAVNGGGSSAWSNVAGVTVPLAPAAPTNLTATATTAKNSSTVVLTWNDVSADETGFTLEWATDAAFTAGLGSKTLNPNTATTTQTKLQPGTVYYFRLRSFNMGGSSAWTSAVVMTPP